MPAEIVTGSFCASYFARYEIEGSEKYPYHPTLNGAESQPYCPCKSFEFSKLDNRTCKHIDRIHREACLWNEQWHRGNNPVLLRPTEIDDRFVIPGKACPNCDGPVVAVKIAV